MPDSFAVFLLLVFVATVLLSQGMIVPVFGETRQMRRRLQKRLRGVVADERREITNLIRDKYLRELSPLQRRLESLPGMQSLARLIEQAGRKLLAHQLVGIALLFSCIGGLLTWVFLANPIIALVTALFGLYLPFMSLMIERKKRMERFEEQMPEAIDIVRRALQAGHPFSATLGLVAEDMDDPVGGEFKLTFADLNYGNDLRHAMLGLLERVPSITVMAFTTSVLVQKETGGNLAEILEQIAKVIRGRFRFHRKVRTLSAEGRLSAWILAFVPIALFAIVSITSPDYLPVLFSEPLGQRLAGIAIVSGVIGVFWIRKIIRIDV